MTDRRVRTGDSRIDLLVRLTLAIVMFPHGSGALSLDRVLARREVA